MSKMSQLSKLKKLGDDFIYALIDNPYECPIVVDSRGIVCFMSRFSKRLIGIDPDESIGKHIKDVISETHLHETLEDGKARIADLLYIAGKQQLISRIPLKDLRGHIIGAVGKGVFNEATKIAELVKKNQLLNDQIQYYQNRVSRLKGGSSIIGSSTAINDVKESAMLATRSKSSVLITGESGTGKEVLAQYIHQNSARANGPFIRVNCSSIPQELFESELFGYESGAFTGARSQGKPGKFELANGGTILLDEIGEMPLPMQVKLLRVLQERTIDRLGGTKSISVDFRLIAATNRNLRLMVKEGTFRMDLYYRINIFHIHAPSLRTIPEDIPDLVHHLVAILQEELGYGEDGISDEAIVLLQRYQWPGNVRELRNVLERALIVARGRMIQAEDLPDRIRLSHRVGRVETKVGNLHQIMIETEKRVIAEALHAAKGNKAKAAKILGIHRTSLYEKMRNLHFDEKLIKEE
jgi:transcriptional regulator with PAS, ATPase and Fis domain